MLTDVFNLGIAAATIGLCLLLLVLFAFLSGRLFGKSDQIALLITSFICFITAAVLVTLS